MILKRILFAFGCLAILLTLVPLIALDYWWVRMFDFPHTQLTALTLLAILLYFFRFDIKWVQDYLFMSIMLGCFAFQLTKIIPYTPLHSYDMQPSTNQQSDRQLALFTSNVLQSNKKRKKVLDDIKNFNPDVVLLCEVNDKWLDAIDGYMNENYSYKKLVPQDNTYGMALYSKLELINPSVHYMVDNGIPSIHSKMRIRTGDTIQFYGIHPTPPLPQHNAMSSDRDTEMMLTARLARQNKLPVIVMGDFNDVAWSNTTKLFEATGMLLDPRVGRGFYNTFSANSYIMRWPLDHIFTSADFRLNSMRRGDDINSDHFPSLVRISYEPELRGQQLPDKPTQEQLDDAAMQIENFKKSRKKMDDF